MRKLYKLLTLLALTVLSGNVALHAQITVYNNTFTGSGGVAPTGGTPAVTFTSYDPSGFGQTGVQIGGQDGWNFDETFANNELATWVDGGTVNYSAYTTAPLSYSVPFNTTLSSNPGVVTWTFNMRTKTAATGFGSANNNAAVVLASTSATLGTAGNGYAVAYSAANNKILELISYTGGLQGTVTPIVISSVALSSATHYASVKVTYTPSTNTWTMIGRDDGNTAFANPAVGVYGAAGSATDVAGYTSTAMSKFGFYCNYHVTGFNSSYSYFDNFTVKVNCTAPTGVSASISPSTVCSGSPLSLTGVTTGTTAVTYSWAGPGGYTSTLESPTIAAAPVGSGGAYIFTAYTALGCPAAATASVTVNNAPGTPIMTPSVATVCNGGSIALTASVTAASSTVLSQDFNTAIAPWTVDNTGSTGTTGIYASCPWQLRPDGYTDELADIFDSPDFSQFIMSNSDSSGSGTTTATKLISPTFSLAGYSSATLSFQHAFESWSGDVTVKAEISTDGGTTWATLGSYIGANHGTPTAFATVTIPLTAYLGFANLKIRFNYNSVWGFYWALDNILITGTPPTAPVPTWSPVANLFTNPGLTTPYAGSALNTVYMHTSTVTTTTIETYTATGTSGGCSSFNTTTLTIYDPTATISGNATICSGGSTPIVFTASPGSVVSYEIIGSATIYTVAIGAAGTATVTTAPVYAATTYSLTGVVTGACASSLTGSVSITVNPPLNNITGSLDLCVGVGNTLSVSPGGSWSSSDGSIASITSPGGLATGVNVGTAIITYAAPTTGCISVGTATVNPAPSPLGASAFCQGTFDYDEPPFEASTPGGTWTATPASVATIDPVTGVLYGISGGTSQVVYTLPQGCFVTTTVNINPLPVPISGTYTVCVGLTTTLTDTSTTLLVPGSWSSSDATIASVNAASGIVAGLQQGTVTVTYTLPFTGCSIDTTITVRALPAAITGLTAVCAGGSQITQSDDTLGGTWSVTPGSIASVTAATGIVTGLMAGVATVTYTAPDGCINTTSITVNELPGPIQGRDSVCEAGSTTALTDTPLLGTWSTADNTFATIDPTTGIATGIITGTTTVTYMLPTGCIATTPLWVNPLPLPIAGTFSVCASGSVTVLNDPTGGGTWSSTNNTIASVNNLSGHVTGLNPGLDTIVYTLTISGCKTDTAVLVEELPGPILGTLSVCEGDSVTALTDTPLLGAWSTSTNTFATIDPVIGVATGILAGTTTVTYTLPTGCLQTAPLTINSLPGTITGMAPICALQSTMTLHDSPGPGTWSSSPATIATVDPVSGVVTGLTAGTATISYVLSTGCAAVTGILVNPLPDSISGNMAVCAGLMTTLTDTSTSSGFAGTWSSQDGITATVDGVTGVVTGITAGTEVITYTLPTGCYSDTTITVNPLPQPIGGTMNVCVGLTTTLTDITTPGTWSNDYSTIATINALSGTLTGVAQGTTVVTYTLLGTGCIETTVVTVNPLPAAITGPAAVCAGLTITFSDDSLLGTWSASPAATATVNSGTGVLTGITAGLDTVTYTLPTGCIAVTTSTVNPLPAPIAGSTHVCFGLTTTLTDATGTGTWSSGDNSVASVDAGGVVTGVNTGTTDITYTLGTGCIETHSITVDPLPQPITGPAAVCDLSTITKHDVSAPGTWSAAPASVATIDPVTGDLTGINPGTVTVTYTLPTSCIITDTVTVDPLPQPITGTSFAVCALQGTQQLNDITSPGTWSIAPSSIATISATGVVTGILAGAATATYTIPPLGCFVTQAITVNPLPSPITGTFTVCAASNTTLNSSPGTGTWTAAPAAVATVNPGGVVHGVSSGTATVTYTLGTGCFANQVVLVNPQPPAVITPLGDTMLCPGGFVELTANTGASLTYQWTVPAGAVTGVTTPFYEASVAGTYKVKVTNIFGCTLTSPVMTVTVNSVTATILTPGGTVTCANVSLLLQSFATGGPGLSYQWEINGNPIAGANAANYGADSTGNYTLIVSNSVGCSSVSAAVAVTANPVPDGTVIAGSGLTFCQGNSVVLTADTGTGYTYQWGSTALGSIPGETGISYTATQTGTYSVMVTNGYGCSITSAGIPVTVNPLPGSTITAGSATVFCSGSSVTLSGPVALPGYTDTYQWYENGAAIPGATNINYTDTGSGVFTIVVASSDGCTDSTSPGTPVTSIAVPVVVPLTATSFCWGGSVTLTADVLGGTGVTFQWELGGVNIPGANSATYTTGIPGSYSCYITSGTCFATTIAVTVTEFPLPNPLVTYDAATTYLHTGSTYLTYQWYYNSVAMSGATTDSTVAVGDGNYAVQVTDSNGCQSISDVKVVSGWSPLTSLGVGAVQGSDIKIYPNPAQAMVHISAPKEVRAVISSIDGRMLIDQSNAKDINISRLADGVYMIMLYDNSGNLVKTEKLVITN